MTDESAAPEVKERSIAKRVLLGTMVVIGAIILVVFLASQTGLDKALLRKQVDAFAASVAEKGRKEGRDIQFTYEDIAITGGFSDRHALILSPQLSVKPIAAEGKQVNPSDNLLLRTSEVAIYPKSADLSKMQVRLEKPVEFFDGSDTSKKLLTVTADQPFVADVKRHKMDGRAYLEVVHSLPASVDLTYLREQQAEGKEEETPAIVPVYETLTVTQDAGGAVRTDLAQDGSDLGEAELKLANIVITPQIMPEAAIKIAGAESKWTHTLNDKNLHVVDAKLHIGDITASPQIIPYAPIALTLDATYEGAAPQTAQDVASLRAQESSIKLNKFALTSKDASLTATADFVANATDVLPVGMATISLTNVPFVLDELRRYQLLNSGNEPMVSDILGLVTGTPVTDIKDATIDISRTRGGSFAIGKTTFEELFATVLKNSMQRHAPQLPEKTPGEPAPAPKKIQVEEGARG